MNYDPVLFGTPTRFGNMAGQMCTFLDQTIGVWTSNALVGPRHVDQKLFD